MLACGYVSMYRRLLYDVMHLITADNPVKSLDRTRFGGLNSVNRSGRIAYLTT